MKKLFLGLLPVFLGGMIAAIVLVLPAKASPQPAWGDPGHGGHQVYGRIDSFPQGLVGDWVVNGTTYTADNQTIFHEDHGSFATGACVSVEYAQPDLAGSLRAIDIQTEYDYKCGNPPNPVSETTGVVISYPVNLVGTWVVNTGT